METTGTAKWECCALLTTPACKLLPHWWTVSIFPLHMSCVQLSPSLSVWLFKSMKMKFQKTSNSSRYHSEWVSLSQLESTGEKPNYEPWLGALRVWFKVPFIVQWKCHTFGKTHSSENTSISTSSPCQSWTFAFKKERRYRIAVWTWLPHGAEFSTFRAHAGTALLWEWEGFIQKEGETPGSEERYEHLISFDWVWC